MTHAMTPEAQTHTFNDPSIPDNTARPVLRLKSREVMHQMREVEIDHEGRIYRLRVTQLNKLILTA